MEAPEPNELRTRILRAAIEVFATHGYGAASVREVVERVGCTKPALYYYFKSKPDLYKAAVEKVQLDLQAPIAQAMQDAAPIEQRLVRFIEAFVQSVTVDPLPARLLLFAAHRPEDGQPKLDLEALHREHHTVLTNLMAQALANGEIRAGLDASDLANALTGMVHHRVLCILNGEMPQVRVAQQIVDLFYNGARP